MSNDVLKKIGTVSKELNLPIHVIRFWEKKIDVLKPIKKPNGTRYFSNKHLKIIEEIKFLLYEKKYSINGVNLLFKKDKQTRDILDEKRLKREIQGLIDDIRSRISRGA